MSSHLQPYGNARLSGPEFFSPISEQLIKILPMFPHGMVHHAVEFVESQQLVGFVTRIQCRSVYLFLSIEIPYAYAYTRSATVVPKFSMYVDSYSTPSTTEWLFHKDYTTHDLSEVVYKFLAAEHGMKWVCEDTPLLDEIRDVAYAEVLEKRDELLNRCEGDDPKEVERFYSPLSKVDPITVPLVPRPWTSICTDSGSFTPLPRYDNLDMASYRAAFTPNSKPSWFDLDPTKHIRAFDTILRDKLRSESSS